MSAVPALAMLDLSGSGLRSLQGMPALPALKRISIRDLDLDGFDQLKSYPELEEIHVTRARILASAVPEKIRILMIEHPCRSGLAGSKGCVRMY
jgi:hypothetical protein